MALLTAGSRIMVTPGQDSPFMRLDHWYRTPLGRQMLAAECDLVQPLLANTFGYYLVQLGGVGAFAETLAASRIRYRLRICDPCCSAPGAGDVAALPLQLPLASDSVDVVFLPHTLDLTPEPRALLAEVERVLIPEGRVILLGRNLLSPWGLRRPCWRRRASSPWCRPLRSAWRVADWLEALGCTVEERRLGLYRPPWRLAQGPRLRVLDRLGERFWPWFGGVYAIRAVKRVATLTPLRPARARRRALLTGGAVRPTTRGSSRA